MPKDDDPMEDYCPACGAYTGRDSVCPNCGVDIFDDSGLSEYNEESEGNGEDDEEETVH